MIVLCYRAIFLYFVFLYFISLPDKESSLKRIYDEQMSVLKVKLEALRADYKSKILEIKEKSTNGDHSGSMLQIVKEKYENEIVLLREVISIFFSCHSFNIYIGTSLFLFIFSCHSFDVYIDTSLFIFFSPVIVLTFT